MYVGEENFKSFAGAVLPLLDAEGKKEAANIAAAHGKTAQNALNDVWRRKLGFRNWNDNVNVVLKRFLGLMNEFAADYTIFWRLLADVALHHLSNKTSPTDEDDTLNSAFYQPLTSEGKIKLRDSLTTWLSLLREEKESTVEVVHRMKKASPKFVPREWMLVDAYSKAQEGDYSAIEELKTVFRSP